MGKISNIDVIPVTIPYKEAFITAYGQRVYKDHVIVRIQTSDGLVGFGESAPVPWIHGETQLTISAIIKKYFAPIIIGKDPYDLEKIVHELDKILANVPIAKAAIDIALHDILGKILGVPVYILLGGCYRKKIPLVYVLRMEDPDRMVEKAKNAVKMGFTTLKMKVGEGFQADIERIKSVREAIDSNVKLRIDANQGWSLKDAIKIIKTIEKHGYEIELIEQPIPNWDLEGMSKITSISTIPIAADESVYSPRDALIMVKRHACDIINIKVMKAGGLLNSKKIVYVSEAAGIPNLVGSMITFGIGTIASAHLSAFIKDLRYASEHIGPLYLKDDILEKPVEIERGSLKIPDKPGLGIGVSEEKIERYRNRDFKEILWEEK